MVIDILRWNKTRTLFENDLRGLSLFGCECFCYALLRVEHSYGYLDFAIFTMQHSFCLTSVIVSHHVIAALDRFERVTAVGYLQ